MKFLFYFKVLKIVTRLLVASVLSAIAALQANPWERKLADSCLSLLHCCAFWSKNQIFKNISLKKLKLEWFALENCTSYQFDNCSAHPIYSRALHVQQSSEVGLAMSPPIRCTLNLTISAPVVPIKYLLVANSSMHHSDECIPCSIGKKYPKYKSSHKLIESVQLKNETNSQKNRLLRIALDFCYRFYLSNVINEKRCFLFPFPGHSLWLPVQVFVSYRFYRLLVSRPISAKCWWKISIKLKVCVGSIETKYLHRFVYCCIVVLHRCYFR